MDQTTGEIAHDPFGTWPRSASCTGLERKIFLTPAWRLKRSSRSVMLNALVHMASLEGRRPPEGLPDRLREAPMPSARRCRAAPRSGSRPRSIRLSRARLEPWPRDASRPRPGPARASQVSVFDGDRRHHQVIAVSCEPVDLAHREIEIVDRVRQSHAIDACLQAIYQAHENGSETADPSHRVASSLCCSKADRRPHRPAGPPRGHTCVSPTLITITSIGPGLQEFLYLVSRSHGLGNASCARPGEAIEHRWRSTFTSAVEALADLAPADTCRPDRWPLRSPERAWREPHKASRGRRLHRRAQGRGRGDLHGRPKRSLRSCDNIFIERPVALPGK